MSEPNRETATLYYINGYTQAEVGRFTDRPLGTIKRRLHEARKQLRRELMAMVEGQLKDASPGKQFTDQVVSRISQVRAWYRGGNHNFLLLTDADGRSYRWFMGRLEAKALHEKLSGGAPARVPDIHAALVQVLDVFGYRIEDILLGRSSPPNMTVQVRVTRGKQRSRTVEAIYAGRDAPQFAAQTGAPLFLDRELADSLAIKRRDGKPMTPVGALRQGAHNATQRFRDLSEVFAELERRPESETARRALFEAAPNFRSDSERVDDVSGGMDCLEAWVGRCEGTKLEPLAAGLVGAVYLRPTGRDGAAKAMPFLERAHQLCPEGKAIAFDLATAYALEGRKDEALALVEKHRFHNAARHGNFASLWDDPRFTEAAGDPLPDSSDRFFVAQMHETIIIGRATTEPAGRTGAGSSGCRVFHLLEHQRPTPDQVAEYAGLTDGGPLLEIVGLTPTWESGDGVLRTVARTTEGSGVPLCAGEWPERGSGGLASALRDVYAGGRHPWKERSESTLQLLTALGIEVDAAALCERADAGSTAALVVGDGERRESVVMDGVDAMSLAVRAKCPLFISDRLAEELYMRGKNGKPLRASTVARRLRL